MKRYRILGWDFDTRITNLTQLEDFNKKNPSQERQIKIDQIKNGFAIYYGPRRFEYKLQNLKDIGPKQFSIVAYHNILLDQTRNSFIHENYYPALTGACALGERILNHLVLDLREYYMETDDYEIVKDQKSFSNWNTMIKALNNWGILLPNTFKEFNKLKTIRHKSLHFNQKLTNDLRKNAFEAVNTIQKILFEQFSGFGSQPWFITSIPGEVYLKGEWESHPFIAKFYVPNSLLVGHKHKIKNLSPLEIDDNYDYPDTTITDNEFSKFRNGV